TAPSQCVCGISQKVAFVLESGILVGRSAACETQKKAAKVNVIGTITTRRSIRFFMESRADATRRIDRVQIQTQIAARIGWDDGERNGKVCVVNDYERIAKVIRFLDEHHTEQPSLETLAEQAGLSPFHFHRLFAAWAGVTPKDFTQCLTLSHARDLLRRGASVLDVALDAGLSGPGRLHDLCVSLDAASPGEIKSGGANLPITAGFANSPFGTCLIGETPRGVCHLSFVETKTREGA